jgi:hypothetical protein
MGGTAVRPIVAAMSSSALVVDNALASFLGVPGTSMTSTERLVSCDFHYYLLTTLIFPFPSRASNIAFRGVRMHRAHCFFPWIDPGNPSSSDLIRGDLARFHKKFRIDCDQKMRRPDVQFLDYPEIHLRLG